jgi:hypothetical protein
MENSSLPAIIVKSDDVVMDLMQLVGLPRELLPAKEKIETVLQQLPSLLSNIREDLRDEKLAKMCIAIGVGLFDSAINYVWNQTVIEIRKRLLAFGLDVIKQLKNKEYTVEDIDSLQDSQLLDMAHGLNLIDNEGYYFLSQCRDIRNNFSAAHPATGEIDNYELIAYINRCVKYSLGQTKISIGVDIKQLLATIDSNAFTEEQLKYWCGKISETHYAQKEAIVAMLFGIYCDPHKQTTTRSNALSLSNICKNEFTNQIISQVIGQYEEYVGKGDEGKRKAAEHYFTQLGMLDCLKDSTKHNIISKACKQMLLIHQGLNNFYNEPPFAEYIYLLSHQSQIPETVKYEFVNTVISCAVGNEYGVSNGAIIHYNNIISNFSPREIEIFLKIPDENTYTSYKVNNYPRCIHQYRQKVLLLNNQVIPPSLLPLYQKRIS